jgi:hypothetical protein
LKDGSVLADNPRLLISLEEGHRFLELCESLLVNAERIVRFCGFETTVLVPDAIRVVGAFAFANSTTVKFVDCGSDSCLTRIEEHAFESCCDLSSIDLPANLDFLGPSCFENCPALSLVDFWGSNLLDINLACFSRCTALKCIDIPGSILALRERCFEDCHRLETVTFESPSPLQTIEKSAFGRCSSIVCLSLPKGVSRVAESAFSGCSRLEFVVFESESNLRRIEASVFTNCVSLRSLTLPETVEFLGEGIVVGCSRLTSVTFSSRSSLARIRLGWPNCNIFEVIGFESMHLGLYLEDFEIAETADDEALTIHRTQMFNE